MTQSTQAKKMRAIQRPLSVLLVAVLAFFLALPLSSVPSPASLAYAAGADFSQDVNAEITATAPNKIKVSWAPAPGEYHIYLAKGTNAKTAALYRVVKPATDALGNVTQSNITSTLSSGIEDNTTYMVWLEWIGIFGRQCSPVKKLTTPRWDVDWNTWAVGKGWWTAVYDATAVKFNISGPSDNFPGAVELYCSASSTGTGAWYIGKFNQTTGASFTVTGLTPNTRYYFIFRKGNSFSKPYPRTTASVGSVAAPKVSAVGYNSATLSYPSVKNLSATWDAFVKGPNIKAPIYVATWSNKGDGSWVGKGVSGLNDGQTYTTYATAKVGDNYIKSSTGKFTTKQKPDPKKPTITSVTATNVDGDTINGESWHGTHKVTVSWIPPEGMETHRTLIYFPAMCIMNLHNTQPQRDEYGNIIVPKGASSWTAYMSYSSEYAGDNTKTSVSLDVYTHADYTQPGYVSSSKWVVPLPKTHGQTVNGYPDTLTTPPAPPKTVTVKDPTGLIASNKTSGSITLKWTPGSTGVPTSILMSKASAGPFVHIAEVAAGKSTYTV